ncbi:hypothetical protein DRH27_04255, partial [Candidatus Falkowbacteria bacterium]
MNVVFGVETPSDPQHLVYMNHTQERFKESNLAKNPYSEALTKWIPCLKTGNSLFFFVLKPFYPEVYLFSWLPLLILFLPVWTWLKVVAGFIALTMLATLVLWNKSFTFFFMKLG